MAPSKSIKAASILETESGPMLEKDKLVRIARAQHHLPYRIRVWKVSDLYNQIPRDFDCSSYVMWIYFMLGFKLPRVSKWQYNYCDKFNGDVLVGDLFFLGEKRDPKRINHVGLYIGYGLCAEAAGGRAGKVIYSSKDKIEHRIDFVGWKRVPLDKSEDSFFRFIKDFPKGSENVTLSS